jgi:hypothetical protein
MRKTLEPFGGEGVQYREGKQCGADDLNRVDLAAQDRRRN